MDFSSSSASLQPRFFWSALTAAATFGPCSALNLRSEAPTLSTAVAKSSAVQEEAAMALCMPICVEQKSTAIAAKTYVNAIRAGDFSLVF